jgi:hypothetical protein
MASEKDSPIGNDLLFCEKHKALALVFLRDAAEAVRHAGIEDPRHLQLQVNKSAVLFLFSRAACQDCDQLLRTAN